MSDKKIDEMLKKRLLDNVHDKAIEKYICENIYQKEALTASIKLIQNLQAEIKRLNANMDVMVKEHERLINNTKSEAIREFAEKLKANFAKLDYKTDTHRKTCDVDFCDKTVNWVIHDITSAEIDNLVKQMVGGVANV